MNKLYEGYSGLSPEKQSDLLARVGFNGCHDMVGLFDRAFRVAQIPFSGQNHVLTSKAPHASSLPPHMPLDMVERVPSALT